MNITYAPSFAAIATLINSLKGGWENKNKRFSVKFSHQLELAGNIQELEKQIETLGFEGVEVDLDGSFFAITAETIPAEYL